mmetsp:Transcript_38774/g.84948  ORF Transcript_38774/g.84948 Transcript_38774/m.84948 type:complete len:266 (+) Transcript_38774:1332-2129(+)
MEDQNAVADEAGKGEHVEGLCEGITNEWPGIPEELLAGLVEAILCIHEHVLVVAAVEPDLPWVSHLECEEQAYCLQLMTPPIHKVTIEDEHGALLRWRTKGVQEEQKIPQLTVKIAENLAGNLRLCQHGLRGEDIAGLSRQLPQPRRHSSKVALSEELLQHIPAVPEAIVSLFAIRHHLGHQLHSPIHDLSRASSAGSRKHDVAGPPRRFGTETTGVVCVDCAVRDLHNSLLSREAVHEVVFALNVDARTAKSADTQLAGMAGEV